MIGPDMAALASPALCFVVPVGATSTDQAVAAEACRPAVAAAAG